MGFYVHLPSHVQTTDKWGTDMSYCLIPGDTPGAQYNRLPFKDVCGGPIGVTQLPLLEFKTRECCMAWHGLAPMLRSSWPAR